VASSSCEEPLRWRRLSRGFSACRERPPLRPFLEQDVSRECTPISNVGGLESSDRESCGLKVAFNIRLEEDLCRIIVSRVAFFLEHKKEVGETLYLLREQPDLALLPACVTRAAMGQGSVGQAPTAGPSVGLPDQSVCAAIGQTVEERVVDGANRAAQVGLQRPPATGWKLLLGRGQKIRSLQDASFPRQTW